MLFDQENFAKEGGFVTAYAYDENCRVVKEEASRTDQLYTFMRKPRTISLPLFLCWLNCIHVLLG